MSVSAHKFFHRGFCLCCIGADASAAGGAALSPRQTFAKARGIVDRMRDAAGEAAIVSYDIRDGLFALEGSGGNILASSGKDGTLLIDAGITVSQPRIKQTLAAVAPAPITTVINTHWHFDHADGNEWIGRGGATIVAHENTLKHLESAQRVEDWDFDFPPAPPSALPSQVFSTARTLDANGETLKLDYYEGGAHTDSDISVLFENSNVLHVGDTYWNGIYPFIDYSTGGSIDGMIRAVERNLAVADDETIVIPGHGAPASNKVEMRAFYEMMVAIRDNVARLKARGLSLVEVQAEKPTARFDAKWGQFVIGPDFFTKLVFEGV